jgi:hypothetical protein
VNWETRIRRLELRYHGEDTETGVTWEEFQHVYRAIFPEKVAEEARTDPHKQWIMNPDPPWNIDRLILRAERGFKKNVESRKDGPDIAADSSRTAETCGTSTCSSPVLSGSAQKNASARRRRKP